MRKRRLQSLGRATFEIWRSDWPTITVANTTPKFETVSFF